MIKKEYQANFDMKSIPKGPNYIINPNTNYEENNLYFKNSNMINETELSNRKFKVINKNDIGNKSSRSYKFRDHLRDNNIKEEFPNRPIYMNNDDPNYTNQSN